MAVLRRTIQHTPYQRMNAGQARSVRMQYQASVANENQAPVKPVDRHVSLELLHRRVPPERWAEMAQRAAAGSPVIEPAAVQERVMKMQNASVQVDTKAPAGVAAQAQAEAADLNASLQSAFRREWDAGRLPGTDADLKARGAKWIVPSKPEAGSELER